MTTVAFPIRADQIADIAPVFYASRRVPYFRGKPGIAKTAFVREGAGSISRCAGNEYVHVRELHLASMSEVDVRGYLVPDGKNAVFTKPEFWADVERYPRGILFLDEFPQAPHEVQKAVAPLILEGRIGEFILPPGWCVMLAGNDINDNSGANTLLAHIVNRICIINCKAPDPQVWATWAGEKGLPYEVIAFAMARPECVFDTEIPAAPDTPYCTPRSLHAVGDIANAYPGGIRQMVDTKDGMAMLNGTIGQGATAELVGLVRTAINLPSFDDILRDPENTRVPTKPDEAYAMIMLAAVRVKIPEADAVIRYLTRFQPNLAVTGMVSMARRDRAMVQNQAGMQWVLKNKELLAKFSKYIVEAM